MERHEIPADEIKAMVLRASNLEGARKCKTCGRPATCYGAYDNMKANAYACDGCCQHGNEDGCCVPVDQASRLDVLRLVRALEESESSAAAGNELIHVFTEGPVDEDETPNHMKVEGEAAVLCGAPMVEGEPMEFTSIPKLVRCAECDGRLFHRYQFLAQKVHDQYAYAPGKPLSSDEMREIGFGLKMLVHRVIMGKKKRETAPVRAESVAARLTAAKNALLLDGYEDFAEQLKAQPNDVARYLRLVCGDPPDHADNEPSIDALCLLWCSMRGLRFREGYLLTALSEAIDRLKQALEAAESSRILCTEEADMERDFIASLQAVITDPPIALGQYTRAEFAAAVDRAHEALHTWEEQAGPGHPLHEAIDRAHEALHSVGGGTERVDCGTRDPEAQRLHALLRAKLESTVLLCDHRLEDLVGGRDPATGKRLITKCGACLADYHKTKAVEPPLTFGWVGVISREGGQLDTTLAFFPPRAESVAREWFDMASAQWSESFLCKVVRGPIKIGFEPEEAVVIFDIPAHRPRSGATEGADR
jgi:hypothetical protein